MTAYTMFLGDLKNVMVIPPRELSAYNATLGHKANHSFKHANVYYIPVYNPRFGGMIVGLQAKRDINKGDCLEALGLGLMYLTF